MDETAPARSAWRQVCRQVEGLALGSSLAALVDRGFAGMLLDEAPAGTMAARLGAHPGPLHALLRALALAGWVERRGVPGTEAMTAPLTPRGRQALAGSLLYRLAPRLLDEPEAWRRLGASRWGLEGGHPVQDHLDGHLALPLLARLREAHGPDPPERLAEADDYLRALGWAHDARLTARGRCAWRMAAVAAYPLSYLPLIRGAPELLLGDPGWLDRRTRAGAEVHVDREADVRFSGDVSLGLVSGPLAEVVLPVFDEPDLDRQPRLVVDVGCGDGRMLQALGRLVRERTLRGRHLDSHPLRLVGTEFEAEAARVAERTLEAPVLFADVGDPEGLEERLDARGDSLRDALILAKSVVHNRSLQVPEPEEPPESPSRAAFLDAAGRVVSGARVEADLRALLRRWRPFLRHGLAVAEPHAREETEAPGEPGRNLAAAVEYTHALSRQHLVEVRIHARAVREAGLRSLVHRATDSMTLDLLVPDGGT